MDSKHIDSLLKSEYKAKDMGTLGFEDSDVKSLLLLNRVFRVGVDQTGQYLDIEPDLRHAPLIMSESGCITNTKAVSTSREELQGKLVLDGRRSPILNRDNATRHRSACTRLSYSQSRGRGRRDWWLSNHTLKSGSALRSLTALSVGEAEFYAVVKGGQVGLSLRSFYQDLGIPMKIEKATVRRRILRRIDGEQDSERNTSTRGTSGYQTEPKMETSVSRRCLQRRIAQMLERDQSLLQFYNNIASLQDWYATDHGSHTPPQDDGDELIVDLVTGLQTRRH